MPGKPKKAPRSSRVPGLGVARFDYLSLQTSSGPATLRAKKVKQEAGSPSEVHSCEIVILAEKPSSFYRIFARGRENASAKTAG
jgi:hypothetical protein